jgi:hypothetical protein
MYNGIRKSNVSRDEKMYLVINNNNNNISGEEKK